MTAAPRAVPLIVPAVPEDNGINDRVAFIVGSGGDGNYDYRTPNALPGNQGANGSRLIINGNGDIHWHPSNPPVPNFIYNRRFIAEDGVGGEIFTTVFVSVATPLTGALSSEHRTSGGSEGETSANPLSLTRDQEAAAPILATLAASGGVAPYTFEVVAATGPNAIDLTVSVIAGNPNAVVAVFDRDSLTPQVRATAQIGIGTHTVSVEITDALGTQITTALFADFFVPPLVGVLSGSPHRADGSTDGETAANRLRIPQEVVTGLSPILFTISISGGAPDGTGAYQFAPLSPTDFDFGPVLDSSNPGLYPVRREVGSGQTALGDGEYRLRITDDAGTQITVRVFYTIFFVQPLVATLDGRFRSDRRHGRRNRRQSAASRPARPQRIAVLLHQRHVILATLFAEGGVGPYTFTEIASTGPGAVQLAFTVNVAGDEAAVSFDATAADGIEPAVGNYTLAVRVEDSGGRQITSTVFIELVSFALHPNRNRAQY